MVAADFIIIAIVALIAGLSALYLYKAKKRGVKCVGCPEGAACPNSGSAKCSGCGGNCGN